MRNSAVIVLLLLGGVVTTAPAKTKKDPVVPKLFCHARYVYVQTYEGALNAELAQRYPDDYNAAMGVEQRIQRWDRYKLTYNQQDAELIFVVWKEPAEGNRLPGQPTQMPPVSVPQMPDPGTGPGQYPPGTPGQGPGMGSPGQNPRNPRGAPGQNPGDMGGPDGVGISDGGPGVAIRPVKDQLAVYLPQNDQSLQAPIWKKSDKDGLKEPHMPLFRQLADAVDDACPNDEK